MQHTSALLVGLRLTSLSQCVSRFCHNCHTHLCFRGWRTTLAVLFKTATHPFGHALEIALKSPLENAGDKRLEFLELEGHLDSTLVQRFIQVSGSIRSDQSWKLNTGETGIVKQVNHHAPLAPVVFLVKSAGNTLLSMPHEQDLSSQTKMPPRTITAILDPYQAGIDATLYLDKKAA